VNDGDCLSNPNDPYQWGDTRAYRSAFPLNVAPSSLTGCTGVVIQHRNNILLPMARVTQCNQLNGYVCQFILSNAIRSSSATISTTTTAARETSKPFTVCLSIRSTLSATNKGGSCNKASGVINYGFIAGIEVCGILLLLLFSCLYFWRIKKFI